MSKVEIGSAAVTIEDVVRIAAGADVVLSGERGWRERVSASAAVLEEAWRKDGAIYGVTTGYGDSCKRAVPPALVPELPLNLLRFHGCGMGNVLSPEAARAVMAVRLVSLARGYSGVSMQLIERLAELLNRGVAPVIPEEGSVGASGDLTPLSYIAAMLVGEREVFYQGLRQQSAQVHELLGLEPLTLLPKEGLALMNGTSMMTALACLAFDRAEFLARCSSRISALASEALQGNLDHFDDRLFAQKPHPGQTQAAEWMRRDLRGARGRASGFIQDPYSLRCAPHVVGVLVDALRWTKAWIETEINSSNDNPLIDPEDGRILHGGHFYGGHVAFAMDALKSAIANIADLCDRQLALLVNESLNRGLPANLSGASVERRAINHGFKAVQIGTSAWAAEALKLTMPASVFSRSTECHNQDKVSMGSIAARDCLRVLELTEQVAGATLLGCVQALRLRLRAGLNETDLSAGARSTLRQLGSSFPFLEEDRALEGELREVVRILQHQRLEIEDEG